MVKNGQKCQKWQKMDPKNMEIPVKTPSKVHFLAIKGEVCRNQKLRVLDDPKLTDRPPKFEIFEGSKTDPKNHIFLWVYLW